MGVKRRGIDTAFYDMRVSKIARAKRRRGADKKALAKDDPRASRPSPTRGACAYLSAILASELGPPVLEYRFHDERRWRFDIAYPADKVAVEVHGSVFNGGRHTTGKGFSADREKMNEAQLLGWVVLEYPTQIIRKQAPRIIEEVRRARLRHHTGA